MYGDNTAGGYGIKGKTSATGTISAIYGQNGSTGVAIRGTCVSGTGLYGFGVIGIDGESTSVGVYGKSTNVGGIGVWGYNGSSTGYAVYSEGNLGVTGTKAFVIDHPLDPLNKTLSHYCTESPEPQNVYSGNTVLDANGNGWVQLPDYFESINKDFRYQLTCIGGFAPVYIADKIAHNKFQISGGTPGIEVSWRVEATRNDKWVKQHGATVEQNKTLDKRGTYLSPELFGLPNIASGDNAKHIETIKKK